MMIKLFAVAWMNIAMIGRVIAQSCDPYFDTNMHSGEFLTPYTSLWVPPIPGDALPGGLYVAGNTSTPNRILHWNGVDWRRAVTFTGIFVTNLVLIDEDGDGPIGRALYWNSGPRIYRWDGVQLVQLDGGLTNTGIVVLGTWDEDGDGPIPPALFVHGVTLTLNGTTFKGVAKWDGAVWTPMPFPQSWSVLPIYGGVFRGFDPDGDGPMPAQLYLGANFEASNWGGIARWTGQQWERPGIGFPRGAFVSDLEVFDLDGAGPQLPSLIACGSIAVPGEGTGGIVSWDGVAWHGYSGYHGNIPWDLQLFDLDGTGPIRPALFFPEDSFRLFSFDGDSFTDYGRVFGGDAGFTMASMVFDGSPMLFCGGGFTTAFGVPVNRMVTIVGCPRYCPFDINDDDLIDLQDLGILLANFGSVGGATFETGDLDADQDVDIQDLARLLADFGLDCRI